MLDDYALLLSLLAIILLTCSVVVVILTILIPVTSQELTLLMVGNHMSKVVNFARVKGQVQVTEM